MLNLIFGTGFVLFFYLFAPFNWEESKKYPSTAFFDISIVLASLLAAIIGGIQLYTGGPVTVGDLVGIN